MKPGDNEFLILSPYLQCSYISVPVMVNLDFQLHWIDTPRKTGKQCVSEGVSRD